MVNDTSRLSGYWLYSLFFFGLEEVAHADIVFNLINISEAVSDSGPVSLPASQIGHVCFLAVKHGQE